ncbi:MAG: S-layer homology domain-containing protein [Epulopiscium sp.]|nr:S-layer homology domain-containing protein [Candidatus Epulonipiscium sp.]
MKKKWNTSKTMILFLFFLFIPWTGSVFGQPRTGYGKPIAQYKGPLGVEIISFSSNWSNPKALESIYKELLNNFHGEELAYFSAVYIYPDSPEGVAAYYYPDFDFGENGEYIYKKGRYIEIFNGNDYTNIAQFARILSHEYGHHFTYYYLITKENKHFAQWKDTEYANIRNLKAYPKVTYYYNYGEDYDHRWDICEIAAEDYVQLFGSPLAKRSTIYYDSAQRAQQNIKEVEYDSHSFNLLPQENLNLPLATEVSGLYLYWLGLAGYTGSVPTLSKKPQLILKDYYPIYEDYYQYHFQWTPVSSNSQEKYEYTLVAYPTGDSSFPEAIKTVFTGQPLEAVAGSALHYNGDGTMNVLLENYEGSYTFQLFIKDQRGYLFTSDPLEVVFTYDSRHLPTFIDDFSEHWSYSYAEPLLQMGLIKGYPDGTFRADSPITRGEFISLVIRSFYYTELQENFQSQHWFFKEGYFQAAENLGLVRKDDYGKNFEKFKVDGPITREEMAFISDRCLDLLFGVDGQCLEPIQFRDQESFQYKKEIIAMASCHIIQGYPDGHFRPRKNATRGEAIKILHGLLHLI